MVSEQLPEQSQTTNDFLPQKKEISFLHTDSFSGTFSASKTLCCNQFADRRAFEALTKFAFQAQQNHELTIFVCSPGLLVTVEVLMCLFLSL